MGLTRSGRWMRIITSFSSPHSRLCSAAPLPTSVRQVILGVFKCAASQYSLTVWTSCHYQCIPLKPKLIWANWINLSLFLQWSPFTVSSKFQEREDSPRSVKGCFGTPTFGKCTWETRSFPMPWKSRRLNPFPGSHFTTLTVPCWCRCRARRTDSSGLPEWQLSTPLIHSDKTRTVLYLHIYPTVYLYFQSLPLQIWGVSVPLCLGLLYFPVILGGRLLIQPLVIPLAVP